jgi:hypothetical protein
LRASGSTLVDDEIVNSNNVDWDAIDFYALGTSVCTLKVNTARRSENINTERLDPKVHDLALDH